MKRILLLIVCLSMSASILARPPKTFNYQGRITETNGLPIADGTHTITIQLYLNENDPVSNYIWSENHNVATKNGYFNVVLGKNMPLNYDFNVLYYIGIKVGGDIEMTPRQPLSSVPYSMNSYFGLSMYDSLGGYLPKPIIIMGTGITDSTGQKNISFQNVFQNSSSNPVLLVSGRSNLSGEMLTAEVIDKNTGRIYSWDHENPEQKQGNKGFSWIALGFEFAN